MILSLIAAVADNGVIGAKGDLPWHLPDDMKFFAKTTRGHHVLMGRKNFDSIPEKYRPLPGRTNIVVSKTNSSTPSSNLIWTKSIEEGIDIARAAGESELYIIGGGEIYRQTIDLADKLYITHVHAQPKGETYFPEIDTTRWEKIFSQLHAKDATHNHSFTINVYKKVVST